MFQGKVGQNSTLVDLINYLMSSGQPLSNDNPSTLKFPVDRKQHQLERCQITLGSKIENVNVFFMFCTITDLKKWITFYNLILNLSVTLPWNQIKRR